MKKRRIEIDSILHKLREFENNLVYSDRLYAIQENIKFAETIKSLPRYVWWLLTRAPKIDGSKLLELTDFPVEEWDVRMHTRLMEVEKNKKIKLIKPLVDRILKFVFEQNRPLILANLGAGGMEVDRQVISELIDKRYNKPIIFIGVDKSPITNKIAKENLNSLGKGIEIFYIENLTKNRLEEIAEANKGVSVILCKNNIFNLGIEFPPKYFDLVYNSLFKHHLTEADKEKLDKTVNEISKKYLEYDGYRSWPHIIPQSLVGWSNPVFLNGTIFSMLRYLKRNKINSQYVSFFKNTAHYLKGI